MYAFVWLPVPKRRSLFLLPMYATCSVRWAMPCCGWSSSALPEKTCRCASNRPGGDRLGRNAYDRPLGRTPDLTSGWKGSCRESSAVPAAGVSTPPPPAATTEA